MENLDNQNELMEQKSKQKKDKIAALRQTNKRLAELQKELDEAMPKDDTKRSQNPSRLQEKVDKMEFYIATTAYTPAQEREMIRKVQGARNELKRALADDKTWGKVREVRAKIRAVRQERKDIRKELDALSKELDEIYNLIIAQGTKKAEDRKEQKKKRFEAKERSYRRHENQKRHDAQKKEIAPYMKEVNTFVSLADIAEVKQKKKQ